MKWDSERGVDPEGERGEEMLTAGGKEPVEEAGKGIPGQPFWTHLGGEAEIHIHSLVMFKDAVNRETGPRMDEGKQNNGFPQVARTHPPLALVPGKSGIDGFDKLDPVEERGNDGWR